jgi:hypothetical protein
VETAQDVIPPLEVRELCKSLADKSTLYPEIEKTLILPVLRLFLQDNDENMRIVQDSVFDLVCKEIFSRGTFWIRSLCGMLSILI